MAKKPSARALGGKSRKAGGKPFTGADDPRRHPGWAPGVSGNPSGLPKNRIETASYIEQRLREEYLEQLVTALALHAIKGSPTHIVEALNRVAGKVTDKTELSHSLTPGTGTSEAVKLARSLLTNEVARKHFEAAGRALLSDVEGDAGAVRPEAEPGPLED